MFYVRVNVELLPALVFCLIQNVLKYFEFGLNFLNANFKLRKYCVFCVYRFSWFILYGLNYQYLHNFVLLFKLCPWFSKLKAGLYLKHTFFLHFHRT